RMFWFKLVKSIIKILHSNISEDEVAAGFALGSIIGLTPFYTLSNLFVLILIILLNVNTGAATLGILIFSIIGSFTDSLAHQIGLFLLTKVDFLTPFWTSLYNAPIIPFTKFNNTVILGSWIISLILLIPVFLLFKKFIIYYRANVAKNVEKMKIIKLLGIDKLINIYTRFSQ
ncbi:MAG: TIGR03546 family protein, partial [Elusimicrobiota bacterium]